MAKSSKIKVMISSRCNDMFPLSSKPQVRLSDLRTKMKKEIEGWLYGYASGVNYLTQQDFLKGPFLDYLRASCEFDPDKRMLTVAREITRRLIADTTKR